MATREEIIDVIDAFLEGKITPEEAIHWAGEEYSKTLPCEDPPSALVTLMRLRDTVPCGSLKEWTQKLIMDRKVLIRGVPCPYEELGKKIQAFWLAYTPGHKVVLSQIRRKKDERILEVIEESWDGKQTFYHQMPLPIKNESGPPLSLKKFKEKKKAYKKGMLTRKETLQWVIDQLQRKSAIDRYSSLLGLYWNLRGPDEPFTPAYLIADTETRPLSTAIKGLIEVARKEEKRR